MTQFLAVCKTCGGMVNHLEQIATVPRCDACKGIPPTKVKK